LRRSNKKVFIEVQIIPAITKYRAENSKGSGWEQEMEKAISKGSGRRTPGREKSSLEVNIEPSKNLTVFESLQMYLIVPSERIIFLLFRPHALKFVDPTFAARSTLASIVVEQLRELLGSKKNAPRNIASWWITLASTLPRYDNYSHFCLVFLYCLIGIFRVNLPIAYGEKEGAFYRLQAEIMQHSDDETLFDWEGEASTYSSLFAASPACFEHHRGRKSQRASLDPNRTSLSGANYVTRKSL
ncbi:3289_t:CDS:2, partial [Acaulospora colombiana]